jgi:hypothetical protein
VPVNRDLWTLSIGKDRWPPGWHCPSCKGGYLALVKSSMQFEEAASSRWAHSEDWFEPEHTELRFTALLQCNNDKCKEVTSVCGRGSYQQEMDEEGSDSWQPYFLPLYASPPMNFIPLPESTPLKVSDQLKASFTLLWSSPSAAANHIRIAVENLLDVLRVPRARRIKGVRMERLTLHNRIVQLKRRSPEVADALLAIKWVGNAGSHLGELTRDDLFDAYDILENVLEDLFVKNRDITQKLIREINRRKGPRTKRAKSLI